MFLKGSRLETDLSKLMVISRSVILVICVCVVFSFAKVSKLSTDASENKDRSWTEMAEVPGHQTSFPMGSSPARKFSSLPLGGECTELRQMLVAMVIRGGSYSE